MKNGKLFFENALVWYGVIVLLLSVVGSEFTYGQIKEEFEKKRRSYDGEMTLEEEMEREKSVSQREEPRLSNKWFQGNYLIYDCDMKNFACVNNTSFVICQNQREERKSDNNANLGCTPIKRFNSQVACFEEQYKTIHKQIQKNFCVHPKFR